MRYSHPVVVRGHSVGTSASEHLALLPEPFIVCTLELHVLEASPAACRLARVDPSAIAGQDVLTTFPYLAEIASQLRTFARDSSRNHATCQATSMEHRLSRRDDRLSILSRKRSEQEQDRYTMEERLNLAVEVEHLAVWDRNLETDELSWSDEMYRLLGFQPSDPNVIPTTEFWRSRIHPEDLARLVTAVDSSIENRTQTTIEYRLVGNDGRTRWIQSNWKVFCKTSGKPVRMVGVNADITERREMQTRLSEVNAQLTAIINSSPAPIVALTKEGLVTLWNPAAEQLFGWTESEVLGKSLPFIPEHKRQEHGLLRQRDLEGRNLRGEQLRRVRKDGTPIDISVSTAPVRDAEGNISGIMSLYEDITARLRVERALRESEQRFRTLTEAMPQLVWTTTPEGLCDYLSRQWILYTGVPAEEHYGSGWLDPVHPDDRAHAAELFRAAVAGRANYDLEYRLRRHDGVYRWFKTRGLPVRKEDGRVFKWLGTCTDIEDQKRTMQELLRANADLQQFAYAAAHDLQEPIRGITLYTQLLRRKVPELSPDALTCVSHLFTSAERIEALIQDLLVYTQASEKEETALEPVDCNEVLDYVRRNLESALEASFSKMICGELPRLPGHRTRLIQVFQNLISNAIKYRRKDTPPRIIVTAERRKEEWLFSVADNGIGVRPEFHERIFGVFRRLHSRDIPGTGIGLAICKRIVEGYGGRIWVTSDGDGQGSTFWFTLPVLCAVIDA